MQWRIRYPDTPYTWILRVQIRRNIRSPTRAFAVSIRRDMLLREERFNIFTPPVATRRRVGPGMLIARGTIVGFYDNGMQFPSHVVSYIGNNFVLFQPTCTYARSMGLSSRAFTIRFLPTFDPSVTTERRWRASLKTARFVRRLDRRLTYLHESYDMLRAICDIAKKITSLE